MISNNDKDINNININNNNKNNSSFWFIIFI